MRRIVLATAVAFLGFFAGFRHSGAQEAPAVAEPVFYVSFDQGVNADEAVGEARAVFGSPHANLDYSQAAATQKSNRLQFGDGLKGRAFLTGGNVQAVMFDAKKNLPTDAFTMAMWVKAAPGQSWIKPDKSGHQRLWMLTTEGAEPAVILWKRKGAPFLDFRMLTGKGMARVKPSFDERQWHLLTIAYAKGQGATFYVDGKAKTRAKDIAIPENTGWFRIGEGGSKREPNLLIDEFRIYGERLNAKQVAALYEAEAPGGGAANAAPAAEKARTSDDPDGPATAVVLNTTKPIVIDGKIGDGEWARATVLTGFMDTGRKTLAETQTRVHVTFDDRYLYLAFHSAIPQDALDDPDSRLLYGFVKRDCVNRNDFWPMMADDFLGCFLMPDPSSKSRYRMLVNGLDTRLDSVRREVKDGHRGTDMKWDPDWEIESTLGVAGWDVESRIPLAAFEIGQVEDGDIWLFQFVRQWKLLKEQLDTFPEPATRVWGREPEDHIALVFRRDGGAAPRVTTYSEIAPGRIALKGEAVNASTRKAATRLRLFANGTTVVDEKLPVAARGAAAFDVVGDLGKVKTDRLTLMMSDDDGTILRSSIPYIPPERAVFRLRRYPSFGRVTMSYALRYMEQSPDELSAVFSIADKASGKTLTTKRVDPLPGMIGLIEQSVASIGPGKYEARLAIMEGKKTLIEEAFDYEKKPLPEWHGNKLGVSDEILEPWTPIEVKGESIGVLGRRYDYGGALLPTQIVTRGQSLLVGPMEFRLKTADGKEIGSAGGRCDTTWDERKDGRVVFTKTQALGPVTIVSRASVEYDGFAWMDLEIRPNGKSAAIESLTLEAPFDPALASLINGYTNSMTGTGKVPAGGFASSMGMRWIGWEEGGLQFVAETSAPWKPADRLKEYRILPSDKETRIRMEIVGRPTTLEAPMALSLGYIATPTKPALKNHRTIMTGGVPRGNFSDNERANTKASFYELAAKTYSDLRLIQIWSNGWWRVAPGFENRKPDRSPFQPFYRDDLEKSYGRYKTRYGVEAENAAYCRIRQVYAKSEAFKQFADEWVADINERDMRGTNHATATHSSRSYQDFWLWGIDQFLNDTRVRDLYFDVSRPLPSNNISAGDGLASPDGRPLTTVNIRGARAFMRRVMTLVRQRDPEGLVFLHASGQPAMPVLSFIDGHVDGENYAGILDRKDNRGYENVLTLDQFAAEYNAQNNFGPYTIFLPQLERSGAIKMDEWDEVGLQPAEYVLGLIALHNSQMWFTAYIPPEPCVALYGAFARAGIDGDWRFVGYWKQKAATLPDNVVASFFVSPKGDKAMAVVMNLNDADRELAMPLDAGALGLKGALGAAKDIYGERDLGVKNGAIGRLTIPAKNYRLILLDTAK